MNSMIIRLLFFLSLLLISNELNAGNTKSCGGCNGCSNKENRTIAVTVVQDEFEPPQNNNEFSNVSDTNEFQSVTDNSEFQSSGSEEEQDINWRMLYWPLGAIGFTILAGFFVRYKPTRLLKMVFLVGSAVFLGFYNGACPCPISSMSFVIIGASGGELYWESAVWFLALIPVTFIFGKVWCGWVCHLGALQEFIYQKNNLKFLQGETAQKVMKFLRWFLLFALVGQVIYTHTYLFDVIDPFRIAFNLGYGADLTGWILLGLLLLSSIFVYRPFCKAACPIGLVYGWIAKIPGASVLGRKDSCNGCVNCAKACLHDAIIRKDGYSILDNKECIMCGDCIDKCRTKDITFFRKGSSNGDVVVLEKK